jgi:hypothetical protein
MVLLLKGSAYPKGEEGKRGRGEEGKKSFVIICHISFEISHLSFRNTSRKVTDKHAPVLLPVSLPQGLICVYRRKSTAGVLK